jgi:hypothetical protein
MHQSNRNNKRFRLINLSSFQCEINSPSRIAESAEDLVGPEISFFTFRDMFPIKELPFELRALIYPHTLILQHDNSAPTFLLALAADAVLYAEAQRIYRAINAIVTTKNQDAFGKLKMSELMSIRHLRLVFPGPYVPSLSPSGLVPS